MSKLRSLVEKRFGLVLLIAGAILLFANLGNIYLWQDEAETALLSRRLGMYGFPLAFDGRNLIRQAPQDIQYTEDYVWVYHPWLPFYFTALSFALLGPTTFAARLPYAIAGLATILLLYHSVSRHFRDRRVATLGASFLSLCVPFLLHARQCKYFPFAALFAVATLDAYLRFLRDEAPDFVLPYFILAGFLLFQSNFGAFLPLVVAVCLHFLLSRPTWIKVKRMGLAVGILMLFTVPWGIYLQAWARGRFIFDAYRFVGHMVHYMVYITGWVLPCSLVLLFAYWYLKKDFTLGESEVSALNLYLLVILSTLLFLSATFVWIYFSYIVQLVPLLMVILALAVLKILDRFRMVGYGLIVLLVMTNVLHIFPYVLPLTREFKWASLAPRRYLAETDALIELAGSLHFDLASYLYELTHDYDGPDEGIVLFLREHARPGDVVLTSYGELPIVFYIDLDIAGGLSAYRLDQVKQPEWVIDRWEGFYKEAVAQIIANGNYQAIEIPYPDILWGNRPVPEYHKYATVRGVPNVVIYRRMD
ncbi:MAG: ArnT family glycosyltransferase [Anaerolineae bacterium]